MSKGWFNVNETRIEAYLAGPLRRQLKETGFIMQVELTAYVCRCARELLKSIEIACEGDSLVLKKNLVEVLLCPKFKLLAHKYEKEMKEEVRDLVGDIPNINGKAKKSDIFPDEFMEARHQNDLLNVERIPPFFTLKLKVTKKDNTSAATKGGNDAAGSGGTAVAGGGAIGHVICEDDPAQFVEAVDRMLEVLSTVAGIHQV